MDQENMNRLMESMYVTVTPNTPHTTIICQLQELVRAFIAENAGTYAELKRRLNKSIKMFNNARDNWFCESPDEAPDKCYYEWILDSVNNSNQTKEAIND